MTTALVKNQEEKAVALRPADPIVGMLQKVIEGGITAENVAAMEKMLDVYERMQGKQAERDFSVAFNAMQGEMPIITAKTVIPNRGKYEKFEDLMKVVGPLLSKHGFSVSFSMDFKDNRIIETCTLSHVSGFSRANSFAVRSGGRADSDTQADCKAATTAKRNALCNALNISIRQDCLNAENDAGIEGGAITEEQAFELERRVAETNSDKAKFLRVAGAKTFADIPAGKYATLDELLKQKEQRR